eukprot:1073494-Prorocentrum_minimum.AAC.1
MELSNRTVAPSQPRDQTADRDGVGSPSNGSAASPTRTFPPLSDAADSDLTAPTDPAHAPVLPSPAHPPAVDRVNVSATDKEAASDQSAAAFEPPDQSVEAESAFEQSPVARGPSDEASVEGSEECEPPEEWETAEQQMLWELQAALDLELKSPCGGLPCSHTNQACEKEAKPMNQPETS